MGDVVAARERLEVLNQLPLLEIHENARELARHFVAAGVIPANVEEDALHLAIAATNGVHYLVTWNCKHLANVTMRPTIEHACRSWGYQPPVICTPELLLDNS